MENKAKRKQVVSNKLKIGVYCHCAKCLKELPSGESAQSYSRYSVGWTELGLQVWCNRHNANVMNVDFEGIRHPANVSCTK